MRALSRGERHPCGLRFTGAHAPEPGRRARPRRGRSSHPGHGGRRTHRVVVVQLVRGPSSRLRAAQRVRGQVRGRGLQRVRPRAHERLEGREQRRGRGPLSERVKRAACYRAPERLRAGQVRRRHEREHLRGHVISTRTHAQGNTHVVTDEHHVAREALLAQQVFGVLFVRESVGV
jgi:hypothetical protein